MKQLARIALLLWLSHTKLYAQPPSDTISFFEPSPVFDSQRFYSIIGTEAVLLAGSYLMLNRAWYSGYPQSDFHLYNDGQNWLQVDKVGHAFTAYQVGYAGLEFLEWSGVEKPKAALYGGSLGLVFLSGIELLDGHSAAWGFSWGDMAANAAGTALLLGQEAAWREQRISLKFSYHPSPYAAEYPELLGSNWSESLLKDYNGQTYWLSANLQSFTDWQPIPDWLNLAVGYGADGMITSFYQEGLYQNNPQYKFQRQFYLAPDIDLRRLKVKKPFWRALFKTLNCVKLPLPALEFNEKGGVRFYPIYF